MLLKFLVFALAVALVTSKDAAKEERSDVIVCASKPGDVTLSYMQVSDEGHKLGKAVIDLAYPPDGEIEANVINCIIVKDLEPDIGATATITNGTIGGTRVAMRLESSFTKGLSFSIKIMGQKMK